MARCSKTGSTGPPGDAKRYRVRFCHNRCGGVAPPGRIHCAKCEGWDPAFEGDDEPTVPGAMSPL